MPTSTMLDVFETFPFLHFSKRLEPRLVNQNEVAKKGFCQEWTLRTLNSQFRNYCEINLEIGQGSRS